MKSGICCAGRIGDVLSALPIAWDIARKTGHPTPFIVAAEFASVLEGCSYVRPLVWPGSYKDPRAAAEWAAKSGWNVIPAQHYGWTDHKTQPNFQRDAWALAGYANKWGTLPTVIDQRSWEREAELLVAHGIDNIDEPIVALCLDSHSSPFPLRNQLNAAIRALPGIRVVDISAVHAERYFDILGILDRAACLVTVDTAALHLVRASRCPTVAIVNDRDGGWWASEKPPQAVRALGYSAGADMIESVLCAIECIVWGKIPCIVRAFDDFGGTDPRHQRARDSWATTGIRNVPVKLSDEISAKRIGDPRNLPRFKDVVSAALIHCEPHDVLLWTNSDGVAGNQVREILQREVRLWGAVASRRDDEHCGAESFAFTREWWEDHYHDIPEFWLGGPCWDIGLRAYIRWTRGIRTTPENMVYDFSPCDLSQRIVLHEDHPSEWVKHERSPANLENRRLTHDWMTRLGLHELARIFR